MEPDKKTVVTQPDSWAKRRLFMIAACAFCGYCVLYVVHTGMDTKVADTAVTMAFLLLGSIVVAYVFGATWEDISKLKLK